MPVVLLIFAFMALLALFVLLLPLSIIGRYRAGTARRRARRGVALVNFAGIGISAGIFLVTAAVSSFWVPGALSYSAAGLGGGLVLGMVGLRLTDWEPTPQALHYTPNRWLVLGITVAVSVRLAFGFWRMWHAWDASSEDHSWLAESGLAGSMATGAVVLGYYFAYWVGIWWRVRSIATVRMR